MALFHDEDDGPEEPYPGLPQALPDGEEVLWQGRPDAATLAVHAFHVRSAALYLGAAGVLRIVLGAAGGQNVAEIARTGGVIALMAGLAVAVLFVLAWATARKALFTITNKRVVMRHGVALRKYINVPFCEIRSADLRRHASGAGDIALSTSKKASVPYFHLWPFARPMRFTNTIPLIRAIPRVDEAARKLVTAMAAAAPEKVAVTQSASRPEAKAPALPRGSLKPEISLS